MLHRVFLVILLGYCNVAAWGQELPTQRHYPAGLRQFVEIITDQWGIPHIYAQNEEDLFFAQGWYASKDRLFQFELWRRQATGTVAEILGANEIDRDIGTRLFRYRGDIRQELNMYHERGEAIIKSYVGGINAYIDQVSQQPRLLPVEFRLLGITPQHWTPEVVISRHQGLLGNIAEEIDNAMIVHRTDTSTLARLKWFHPQQPKLTPDSALRLDLINDDILHLYRAYRTPLEVKPEHIVTYHRTTNVPGGWADATQRAHIDWERTAHDHIGSNNWVLAGRLTESGYPIMANDPHRVLSAPSLRYMAHLVAPGWNVIGAGEPTIPGISIGHNGHGAWGLTVYSTDAEDLYVYELHPTNHRQYRYRGAWEDMQVIADTILVKDATPLPVTHRYTRHGPVLYVDTVHHVAYAMRCGWLEPGGAPYLASLRMDQSRNWDEFRLACRNSNIPGENMVWADRDGHIGWQAVGIAPIRRNWSGLLPVPGDGRYEWDGYMPNLARPHRHNPPEGYLNTSNENVTPTDYGYWQAVGFNWADPFRGDRVKDVLQSRVQHSMADMLALQTDYMSVPARQITALYRTLRGSDIRTETMRKMLLAWDCQMTPQSVEAGIYHMLEGVLKERLSALMVPEAVQDRVSIQLSRYIDWLYAPTGPLIANGLATRDQLLLDALTEAGARLAQKLGTDIRKWQYGQAAYKHALIPHPLSGAVSPSMVSRLSIGPLPRGGDASTVNNTSNSENQRSGASFRIIVDTGDWDRTMAMNSPGQSGDPDHPHYSNLFELWATDRYFPLYYSREKIEAAGYERWLLEPR